MANANRSCGKRRFRERRRQQLQADLHDDVLRVIAEFAAEDVQAAAILRLVVNADANSDRRLIHQLEVADGHVGNARAIEE